LKNGQSYKDSFCSDWSKLLTFKLVRKNAPIRLNNCLGEHPGLSVMNVTQGCVLGTLSVQKPDRFCLGREKARLQAFPGGQSCRLGTEWNHESERGPYA
jgi:hypothetical protein